MTLTVAVAVAAAGCVWAAGTTAFHIAPTGSDTNPGTKARPFATVERARDAVRGALPTAAGDVVVELAAGRYELARPLAFGPDDSGRNGHRVIYRAARGARVVLSGGRRVTGWRPDRNGRWRARVSIASFRQLWVNGARAQRARGDLPADLQPWGHLDAVVDPTPGAPSAPGITVGQVRVTSEAGYTTADAALADWRNPGDTELGYYAAWTHMVCRIASIRREGDRAVIVMAEPGYLLCRWKGGAQAGAPAYMENALELLDDPGEWYLDRPAHTLYYLPRPGEDMAKAEVIAPALEKLVEVRGTIGNPVHDISFEGLTFAHATWLRPSEFGHPDVQANFTEPTDGIYRRTEAEQGLVELNGEATRSPANVLVAAGRGVRFEGCEFTAFGGAGLDLQEGAQGCVVRGCIFHDISATGVQVGDVTAQDHHPSDPRRTVKGNQVLDCVITRCGVEFQDSIGVFCGYTDGTVVAHNEICYLPYTGVSVGWGWGMPDAGGGAYASPIIYDTPTVCRGNRIEDNHIHHVMLQRTDGGGIYTLSRQPGTILRGNHIHDNGPGVPGGIYLDEGSADITVTGNLVYAVGWPMNYNNHAQNRIATCREVDNVLGLIKTVPGRAGRAAHFGGGAAVDVPYAEALDAPELTVEAWVRIESLPGGGDPRRWVVCKAANEWADTNYSLYLDGGKVGAYLNIGGGQENWYTAASGEDVLKTGQWQHLAMTYDGEALRVCCDGQEVAAQQVGKARTRGPAGLSIGGRVDKFGPVFLVGDVDEVRIYSRALSAGELRANMDAERKAAQGAEAAVAREGLAGYWGFDDDALGEQQKVADRIAGAAGLEPAYRGLLRRLR